MRTDSLFYKIFQTLPESLFELLGEPVDALQFKIQSSELADSIFEFLILHF